MRVGVGFFRKNVEDDFLRWRPNSKSGYDGTTEGSLLTEGRYRRIDKKSL